MERDTSAALTEHYDAHYRAGGFGYRAQRDHWLAWARRHYVEEFDLRPGERLLDVGCGDGFWSGLFAELGLRPTGIDLSEGAVEVARTAEPGVRFEIADVDDRLPFPEGSFDIVFCRAISHLARPELLSRENRKLVARLVDQLAPGGLLLISYSTTREGGGPVGHAQHPTSDLVRLLESAADPCHFDLVGNYLQIAAQRRDAPRGRRRPAGALPRGGARVGWLAGSLGALRRRLRRLRRLRRRSRTAR